MEARDDRNGVWWVLFFGSGCAALIYEVVWFQQLGLILGTTSVSLAIVLTSFMGGLCLGSLGYARFGAQRLPPLRVYALLELAIGAYGLASLWLLPAIGSVYWSIGTPGATDLPWRAIVTLAALLPPTVLMGATLPAVARGVAMTSAGAARIGWFYGANTCGAVAGSLLAGLYLLRTYDVVVATLVAAGLNGFVALAAWRLSGAATAPREAVPTESAPLAAAPQPVVWLVIGLSGFTALGAEAIWTRLLGLLLGPTVYTFSLILAVFLFGLGVGSAAGSALARRLRAPSWGLAATQLLLLAAIPYAAWMIVDVLPNWLAGRDADISSGARMGRDLCRAAAALFPAACLWGASFPLAVAAAAGGGSDDGGRVVGRISAANTLGAILGALALGLWVHPWGGAHLAQQLLTCVAAVAGLTMLAACVAPRTRAAAEAVAARVPATRRWAWSAACLAVIAPVALGAAWCVPAVPNDLLAYGNNVSLWRTAHRYLYVAEGRDAPVAVVESQLGVRCFHVAGRIEATNSANDRRTQYLLGHLPAVAHPHPRTVLVIGCGSGMTAGAFLRHPSVEKIVVCEIEPRVVEANREHFAAYNGGVLDHPRTHIVYDDARHYLATTHEKFDVITTDPIHPWIRGSAALYTQEFFELCRSRLTTDGVVTQWIPLYESNLPAVKCELATLLKVFPQSLVFNGDGRDSGYDLVVVGTSGKSAPSPRRMIQRLFASDPAIAWSLAEVGLSNGQELWRTLIGHGRDFQEFLKDAQINRDGNLRLQYLAGLTPDAHTEVDILRALLVSRARSHAGGDAGERLHAN